MTMPFSSAKRCALLIVTCSLLSCIAASPVLATAASGLGPPRPHSTRSDAKRSAPKHGVYVKGNMAIVHFTPAKITIKTGQTVTWINTTGQQQTATSHSFNVNLLPHKRGYYTFKKRGTFQYKSVFFPNATGTVIVRR